MFGQWLFVCFSPPLSISLLIHVWAMVVRVFQSPFKYISVDSYVWAMVVRVFQSLFKYISVDSCLGNGCSCVSVPL